MPDNTSSLSYIIKTRRTTKPPMMNGKKIPDEQIWQLLQLADWAPTHANTEPWRFVVYADPKVFCAEHAELYRDKTPAQDFMQFNYEKLLHMGDKASHVIIGIMQRGPLSKIPVLEEIAATACAMQNILLGATELGIASYWGSGGMAYKPEMKEFLNLKGEDVVMGILYLGYTDSQSTGERTIPLDKKVKWIG
ncbi:nitroreductase [Mucilaginibacter sp. PPCGB 2223]|uniref:nitroreductase family protein n=1 Tax=Mucilaginibacter sp. PPCGB 2223 TaxID=1886027 RepID=UPI00082566D0|nr:nitroreductase [Mucilaginibacter sp. PPCGB 2223]OCX53752.1 nitroreductase [Mucilaginibacter sp. PPCGB 2223]